MHCGSSTLMIIIDLMKIGGAARGRRLSTHCSVMWMGGVPLWERGLGNGRAEGVIGRETEKAEAAKAEGGG